MGKLFVVIFEAQKEQVERWCWGPGCGHGILGGVDLFGQATGVPCRQEACPYLDRELSESEGKVDGDDVYLRKLRDVTDADREQFTAAAKKFGEGVRVTTGRRKRHAG